MVDFSSVVKQTDMGDPRRNERVLKLLNGISQGQSAGSHGTQGAGRKDNWARVMGAYRFFNNEQVPRPVLHDAVIAGLRATSSSGQRRYVVHDLSTIDYSGHESKADRTQVGNERGLGYELFTSLVLDSEGRPLGPCLYELRTSKGVLSSADAEPLPYTDHYEQVERGALASYRALPDCDLVQVGDREFDELQLQRFLATRGGKYVVRACHLQRSVGHQGEHKSLSKAAQSVVLRSTGKTVERKGKEYDVYRGETNVVLDGESHRGVRKRGEPAKQGAALEVRAVVSELRPRNSKGKTYRWVLLTNLDDAIDDIVQIYVWRWKVERFFFLTKVGFRLKQWRQETGERIARRLGVTMLAAMMIYQLHQEKTPESKEALASIAEMGGHIPGPSRVPGPMALMRGVAALLGALALLENYSPAELRQFAEQAGLDVALPASMRKSSKASFAQRRGRQKRTQEGDRDL